MVEICFQYDETSQSWEVIAKGVPTPLAALQAFNAVLVTSYVATPRVDYNKAILLKDGSYKICIGM